MADAPRACKNCASYKWVEGNMGECRHGPPTAFMLALPSGTSVLGPGGQPGTMGLKVVHPAAWPAVREDQWCVTGYRPRALNGKGPGAEPSGGLGTSL